MRAVGSLGCCSRWRCWIFSVSAKRGTSPLRPCPTLTLLPRMAGTSSLKGTNLRRAAPELLPKGRDGARSRTDGAPSAPRAKRRKFLKSMAKLADGESGGAPMSSLRCGAGAPPEPRAPPTRRGRDHDRDAARSRGAHARAATPLAFLELPSCSSSRRYSDLGEHRGGIDHRMEEQVRERCVNRPGAPAAAQRVKRWRFGRFAIRGSVAVGSRPARARRRVLFLTFPVARCVYRPGIRADKTSSPLHLCTTVSGCAPVIPGWSSASCSP